MAGEPKAKVIISADTAEFNKGIKSAKADMKAFGDVSDNILGKLGQALGVDTKQLDQMSSAIRGMGMKLGQAGGEGSDAFKKIASGAATAAGAIAGLGLAGALVAFKALTAEAANFKSTVAGANLEMATAAYVQTYQQVMHDFSSETGKAVAETESRWKKLWGTWKSNVVAYFASGAFKDDMNPWSNSTAGREAYEALKNAATEAGQEAGRISGEIFKIDRQRSDNLVKIAELEQKIAENQRIMKSDSATLAEKNAAYAAATQAINDKYALQLPLMQQRASLLREMTALAGSTVDQVDAANQAAADAVNLAARQEDELRSLERLAKGITTANNQTNAALKEQLKLQEQIAASRAWMKGFLQENKDNPLAAPTTGAVSFANGGLVPQVTNTTAFKDTLRAELGGALTLELEIGVSKGQLHDLSQQLTSWMSSTAEALSSVLGGLIGDLITGGDAWGNFANAALSAFGDMATAVGKIAIETGIASLGIKASLETLGTAGPAIAIAAGAALIALGAAVKAGLSNVASGSYSSGYNVASSSYTNGGGDYETRELNVKVTGTMVADGSQLKAVLKSTDNRDSYTT